MPVGDAEDRFAVFQTSPQLHGPFLDSVAIGIEEEFPGKIGLDDHSAHFTWGRMWGLLGMVLGSGRPCQGDSQDTDESGNEKTPGGEKSSNGHIFSE